MFCSKCGSELAEGARFCSVCGARVEAPAEHPVENTRNKVNAEDKKSNPVKAPKKKEASSGGSELNLNWDDDEPSKHSDSGFSFDWSSVIDEGKRKNLDNVHSPWDDDEELKPRKHKAANPFEEPEEEPLEKKVFGSEKPSKDPGRTMNFIDILKQEQKDKEREANGQTDAAAAAGSAAPEKKPAGNAGRETILPMDEREKTQGYTDLQKDIIAEMEQHDSEALTFEQQLENIRAERRAARMEEKKPEPPQSFVDNSEQEFEKIIQGIRNGKKAALTEPETAEELSAPAEEKAERKEDISDIFGDSEPAFHADEAERDALRHEYTDEYTSVENSQDIAPEDFYADFEPQDDSEAFGDIEEIELPDDEDEDENVQTAIDEYLAGEEEISGSEPVVDEIPDVELKDENPADEETGTTSPAAADESADSSKEPDAKAQEDTEEAASEYEEYGEYFDYIPRGRASRAERYAAMEEDEEDEEDADVSTGSDEPVQTAESAEQLTAEAVEEAEPGQKPSAGAAEAASVKASEPASEPEEAAKEVQPSASAEKQQVDDEIALLQQRLEALMRQKNGGAPAGEPSEAVKEEEAEAETPVAEAASAEEPAPEESEPEDAAEPAAQVSEEPAQENIAEAAAPDAGDEEPSFEVHQIDLDKELEQLGLGFETEDETPSEDDMFFTSETTDVSDGSEKSDTVVLSSEQIEKEAEAGQEPTTIDSLEKELFGGSVDPADAEATKRIDKFYTLYRKNEEFQKLLDEEYNKLQGGADDAADEAAERYDSSFTAAESAAQVAAPAEQTASAPAPAKAEQEAPAETPKSSGMNSSELAAAAAAATAASAAASEKKIEKRREEKEEKEDRGGSVLTVIAIVVAVLLVILLAIILILNFMPESSIAQRLNEMIGNYANFFGSIGGSDTLM